MKSKLVGIALFGITLASVIYYPQLAAKQIPVDPRERRATTGTRDRPDEADLTRQAGMLKMFPQPAKEFTRGVCQFREQSFHLWMNILLLIFECFIFKVDECKLSWIIPWKTTRTQSTSSIPQSYQNRHDEDPGGIESGRVSFMAAY